MACLTHKLFATNMERFDDSKIVATLDLNPNILLIASNWQLKQQENYDFVFPVKKPLKRGGLLNITFFSSLSIHVKTTEIYKVKVFVNGKINIPGIIPKTDVDQILCVIKSILPFTEYTTSIIFANYRFCVPPVNLVTINEKILDKGGISSYDTALFHGLKTQTIGPTATKFRLYRSGKINFTTFTEDPSAISAIKKNIVEFIQ